MLDVRNSLMVIVLVGFSVIAVPGKSFGDPFGFNRPKLTKPVKRLANYIN